MVRRRRRFWIRDLVVVGGVGRGDRAGLSEAGEVVDDSSLMENTPLRVEGEQHDLLELEPTTCGRNRTPRAGLRSIDA